MEALILSVASLVTQTIRNLLTMKEREVRSLGQEDTLEKGMATTLQYSCLENSMSRGAWRATVHGVTKSQTQLSDILKAISKYSLILGTGVGFHHELGVGGKQTLSNL